MAGDFFDLSADSLCEPGELSYDFKNPRDRKTDINGVNIEG